MTIACQPNAFQRRSNCPMSCCHIVVRLWPKRLTSVMPHRLSSLSIAATPAASQPAPRTAPPARRRVAAQPEGGVAGLGGARVERGADRGADALTERAGCDVDER